MHINYVFQATATQHTPPPEVIRQSAAGRALRTLREKHRPRIMALFRTAHAVAKHNRPIRDYVWITKLDQAKGLGCVETGPNTYVNDDGC